MARNNPDKTDAAAIYAIAAEMPNHSFVVKIGMTGFPYMRYGELITGIPFPSGMKWSWVGMRSSAHEVEASLHRSFAERNTAREWFHFNHDEGEVLWRGMSAAFLACAGRLPKWETITEEQVAKFMQARYMTPAAAARKKRLLAKSAFRRSA